MSWRGVEATCRHAARIGETLLDGGPLSATDRLHMATCAVCTREAEAAARFLGRLAVAAEIAMDDVPAIDVEAGASRWIRRVIVPAALFAGAAAAGLLLAAVVGLRLTPPVGEAPTLGSLAAAEERLAGLDLECMPVARGASCESRAPDHVHRVLITARADGVIGMEAGIIGTRARAIDLRGADDLLRRMTAATLEGSHEATATAWLAVNYAGCTGTCSADLAGLRVALEKRDDAVIFSVEAR